MEHFSEFLIVGFLAQLIDGALGMAYGLTSTSLLLSLGVPPLTASATTHMAECITSGFSGIAHHHFGNIDRLLFRKLVLPGILGAILGAFLLTHLKAETIKPFVGLYLLTMGLIILLKAFREIAPKAIAQHLTPLGLIGGLLDAIGGGGWGSLVVSTLLASGNEVRTTIGSVTASQFFVTVAASTTFVIGGANIGWYTVLALSLGGACAAPLGPWLCKHLPARPLLFIVGLLIVGLSSRTLWLSFKPDLRPSGDSADDAIFWRLKGAIFDILE